MTSSNAADRFQLSIRKFIEKMLELLMKCRDRDEKIKKIQGQLKLLDEKNPDLYDLLGNTRENIKMYLCVIIWFLCILIDYFLLFNGLTLLTNRTNLILLLKVLVPIALVSTEVAISYFAILKQNSGERVSWLYKNLQYFVIGILIAISVVVIFFTGRGYNPQFDGNSYWSYVIGSVFTQVVLLIPAIMLHLWIIKNAEEIADAIAYFKYRYDRRKIVSEIELLEKVQRKDQKLFVQWVHSLVQQMDSYRRKHPNVPCNFGQNIPLILSKVINAAMGRRIFDDHDSFDSPTLQK